jgi:glycosyltransferase involved in cell wall biosynthesis
MMRFSVVIPAFNEQDYLPRLLDSVEQARNVYAGGRDAIEVIVANNQSTDDTESVARDRRCRVVGVGKRSIAAARNGGAEIATGEVLCFMDADFVIHPQSFNVIDAFMSEGNYCGGATGAVLDRYSLGLRVTEIVMTALVRLAGVNTGIIFCCTDVFEVVGGYNEAKKYAEDVEFFRAMRKCGKNRGQKTILSTDAPASISTRKFDKHSDWHVFRMFLWIPFRYGSYENWIHAYWYDDKERF